MVKKDMSTQEAAKVYIALLSDGYKPSKILGVFSTQQKATAVCLSQPTYMRCEWIPDGENSWYNGSGLYVQVVEYDVE